MIIRFVDISEFVVYQCLDLIMLYIIHYLIRQI